MSEIEIIQKVSAGAFGTVYLAKYQNQTVAVKQFYLSEKDKKKAQREISIHQLFKSHPNIVAFYNIEVKDQLCSIIMQYCQYDLQQFIQNSFYPLSHKKIKKMAYMILRGIEAIHQQGVVHRVKQFYIQCHHRT